MKIHKTSLTQCLAQNTPSINAVVIMTPLLPQTIAIPSALWLQTWGGHWETFRDNIHIRQYSHAWYKPVGQPGHTLDQESRVTKRPLCSCTGSKWATGVVSDLRILKWEKIKPAQHATLGPNLPLYFISCCTKAHPMLQSQLNSLSKQFNLFHASLSS